MKYKSNHSLFKKTSAYKELLVDNNALDLLDFDDTSNLLIENERKRLSMDLHDELGQIFSSVKLDILSLKFLGIRSHYLVYAALMLSVVLLSKQSSQEYMANMPMEVILDSYKNNILITIKGKTQRTVEIKPTTYNVIKDNTTHNVYSLLPKDYFLIKRLLEKDPNVVTSVRNEAY